MEKLKVKPNFKAHHSISRKILRQNVKFHKNRTKNKDSIAKIVQHTSSPIYSQGHKKRYFSSLILRTFPFCKTKYMIYQIKQK